LHGATTATAASWRCTSCIATSRAALQRRQVGSAIRIARCTRSVGCIVVGAADTPNRTKASATATGVAAAIILGDTIATTTSATCRETSAASTWCCANGRRIDAARCIDDNVVADQ
jgi:hypothetical protein